MRADLRAFGAHRERQALGPLGLGAGMPVPGTLLPKEPFAPVNPATAHAAAMPVHAVAPPVSPRDDGGSGSTPPDFTAARAGNPWAGAIAKVAAPSPSVLPFLFPDNGTVAWNESIGIGSGAVPVQHTSGFLGSNTIRTVDTDAVALLAAPGANDAAVNEQMALVLYWMPVALLGGATTKGQIHSNDLQDGNAPLLPAAKSLAYSGIAALIDIPLVLAQPGAVQKLALWLLHPTIGIAVRALNVAIPNLGLADTMGLGVDRAHLYLWPAHVQAAAILLTIVDRTGLLGRPLSGGSSTFLKTPWLGALCENAAAIVTDLSQAVRQLAAGVAVGYDPAQQFYAGMSPAVVDTSAPVATGRDDFNWNRSVGSDNCTSDDGVCADCRGGYDVVTGIDAAGTPAALVCYSSAQYLGQVSPLGTSGTPPTILLQPGMEMKLALWRLGPALNLAASQMATLGGSPQATSAIAPTTDKHAAFLYLTQDHLHVAQAVLSALQATSALLPRGLSALSLAFLATPSITVLGTAAPAIVWDIACAQPQLLPLVAAAAQKNQQQGKTPQFPPGSLAVLDAPLNVYHVFIPTGSSLSGFGVVGAPPSASVVYATDVSGPPTPLPPNVTAVSTGMSTTTKIAIGVGAAAVLGGLAWWLFRDKKETGLHGVDPDLLHKWRSRLSGRDREYLTETVQHYEKRLRWTGEDAPTVAAAASAHAAIAAARELLERPR